MAAVMAMPKPAREATIIPDGTYKAQLVEVKEFTNAFGDRLGFLFEIIEGRHAGIRLLRSTSAVLGAKGQLHQIVTGLLGRDLRLEETIAGVDLAGLVGIDANVLVMQTKGKSGQVYSNIERIFRPA
jgi:hypothetical protein